MYENIKHLYRHIFKENNKYIIRKGNYYDGPFTNLKQALEERDICEKCNWELDAILNYIEENPENKYKDLPKFPENKNKIHYRKKYITKQKKDYKIQKTINGKLKTFGLYQSEDLAIKTRDLLIENNWDMNCIMKKIQKGII